MGVDVQTGAVVVAQVTTAAAVGTQGDGVPTEPCWREWPHNRHDTYGSSNGAPVYPIHCPGIGPDMGSVQRPAR